jgi:hypothetical protein
VVGEQLQGDDFEERAKQEFDRGFGDADDVLDEASAMSRLAVDAMAMTRPLRAVTSWMLESVFS